MSDMIHDRGRGPEIVGTRITVYNLLEHFLDPTATEDYICRLYELSREQVAAARAYVLNHVDTVLAEHLAIEARLAAGNPPEVIERARQTHAAFVSFRRWLAERDNGASAKNGPESGTAQSIPTFREWLDAQPARTAEGS
ncbi:MAG: DUF433 domain-containing protein [Planctomycetes bacterium]|nr:DUF433 domain-containing protein [Planctomycetota bacterium]